MLEEIKKIPKVELHLHLDGSLDIIKASELSGLSISEVKKKLIAPSKCENLSDYLASFQFPISLMQTKENLEEIASSLVNYLESENVVYAEVRFAPVFHTNKGLTYEEVIESVLKGLNSNKYVKTNLILCMMRDSSDEDNLKVIDIALKYLNKGVCAIDLAGAEDKYPLDNYLHLFKLAHSKNIPFTIHAGEVGSASEVKKAIDVGAKRIGHGIHAIDDELVLNEILKKDILLEICPTSNVNTNTVTSFFKHPILKFYRKSIPFSINTDNKTVSNITLSEEYLKLLKTFNFTIDDFYKINRIAIKHAFLSLEEQEELLKSFNK